jgi:spore maturation protein CgeB
MRLCDPRAALLQATYPQMPIRGTAFARPRPVRVRLFYHSLLSDWNHGHAHFLRGVASELVARGHDVRVYEPKNGWSFRNLLEEQSSRLLDEFRRIFPALTSTFYDTATLDLDEAIGDADVVIVHEWTEPGLLTRIASHRIRGGRYRLLFHDTHHRAVSDPDALAAMPLECFDGVLAFGESLAEQYRRLGWGRRVWVWHEAADTRVFHPRETGRRAGDLVWIGNWGDGERAGELREYLLQPVRQLALRARVHGVRYPSDAVSRLREAGIEYAGWIPNWRVPEVFARYGVTVHVPRAPYAAALPGIPTIRPFEALACGMPLISAPWDDTEQLFRPGDYLMVRSRDEMVRALDLVLHDPACAAELRAHGLETIRARHTCMHRVDELLRVLAVLEMPFVASEATQEVP